MKGRVATEWLLTEFPDDTQTGNQIQIASKDFMRYSKSAGTQSHLRAIKFISQSRLRPPQVPSQSHIWLSGGAVLPKCNVYGPGRGTVGALKSISQSHYEATTQVAMCSCWKRLVRHVMSVRVSSARAHRAAPGNGDSRGNVASALCSVVFPKRTHRRPALQAQSIRKSKRKGPHERADEVRR